MLARYAVMGTPIAHSLSPMLHQQFAKQAGITLSYERILLDEVCFEHQVEAFFAAGGAGLNITAPGKCRAFALATVKTPRCFAAGAANTLWIDNKQRICADNTDGIGLIRDLKQYVELYNTRILCLGVGGVVAAILPALLAEKPKQIAICNRTEAHARARVEACGHPAVTQVKLNAVNAIAYDLVINATGYAFLRPERLMGAPFCYDLSYDISAGGVTPFVHWARAQGFSAVDGYGMLAQQAAEAFFVWHGIRCML